MSQKVIPQEAIPDEGGFTVSIEGQDLSLIHI